MPALPSPSAWYGARSNAISPEQLRQKTPQYVSPELSAGTRLGRLAMISRVVNWTPLGPQVFAREEVRLFPPGQLCRQTYLMTCPWRPIAARDVHPLSNQRPPSSDAFRLPYRHIIGAS